MKKIILAAITFLSVTSGIIAQNVTIPDANFKTYLIGQNLINTNGDTEIQVSEANAFTGTINCSSKNISDLTGIEAFINIKVLECSRNQITSLDVSNCVKMIWLFCTSNQLTSIDVSGALSLEGFFCRFNQLTNIDVSNNLLLEGFHCGNNQLSSIDVSNNIKLAYFEAANNQITSIDLSTNSDLTQIVINNNQLTSLNLANGNNTNIPSGYFDIRNNPNLLCVNVDVAPLSDVVNEPKPPRV